MPTDIGTQLAEALRKLEARVSKHCLDIIAKEKPFQAWALGKELEAAREALRLWDGAPVPWERAAADAEVEAVLASLEERK